MPNVLAACHLQEVFFPARKHHTFHRINLEYVVPLQALGRQHVYSLLDAGLRNNLRKFGSADDVLYSLRPQLESLASHVSAQGVRLLQGRIVTPRQILGDSNGDFTHYRAGMGVNFASRKLAESLLAQGVDASQRVSLAEYMLKEALDVNERDYRAHFELGWIYLFMLGRLNDAVTHFGQAAIHARQFNPDFENFALRHLADACYGAKDYSSAVEVCQRAIHQSGTDDIEGWYEYSRYLAADGEQSLAAQRLSHVVARSPVYYVQAQAEPDFAGKVEISSMLQDMRSVRVRRIQSYVHTNWQRHPLAAFQLPDQINGTELFRQVVRQHARILTHLPYVTLSQRERQIGDMILGASQKRIIREVMKRSRHYEQVAERQRSRWGWVNQLGGAFIHVSVVLLLAALMSYLLRLVFGLAGIGGIFGLDTVITPVLGGMLVLAIVGSLLFQFVPFGTRKLLRKQVELDNTLHLLRSF
jgi:tetratricopeptide (TPR) repeat protein